MEMHCVTTSTTLGYLFGQIFPFFPWESPPQDFSWYPSDDVWALGEKKQEKKALQCHVARRGYREGSAPKTPSSSKQHPTGGIQLVNLSFDAVVCSADVHKLLL